MEKLVALDIETTPINPITKDIDKIWCICIGWKEKRGYLTEEIIFPEGITKEQLTLKQVDLDQLDKLKLIQSILNNQYDIMPVFHGSHFEYRHLTESGFAIKNFHDTLLLGYVLNPRYETHSLKAWGERGYCDVKVHADVDVEEFFGTFSQEIVERCRADVKSTLQLAYKLRDELREDTRAYQLYEQIEIPFVPVLVEMCRNGVHIDPDKLTDFTLEVESELETQKNNIHDIVPVAPGKKIECLRTKSSDLIAKPNKSNAYDRDQLGKFVPIGTRWKMDKNLGLERPYQVYRKIEEFNPASSDQKIWALYTIDKYISDEVSDKTGKPKTDKFALEDAAAKGSKIADSILEYQKLNKLYTSFCVPLQNKRHTDSRIYANFNQAVTATGRLSSSDPNLQQIPVRDELGSKLRYCVTPQSDDNLIVSIDLSSAEMRILGWYLAKLIGDDYPDAWLLWNACHKGEDLHKPTIDLLGLDPVGERIVAKTLAFGDCYGMGSAKFARTLKCPLDKANYYLHLRRDRMPSIKALKDLIWDMCRKRLDHIIHTLYGRRLVYPDIVHWEGQKKARAERQSFNAIIQGTQADLIKILMLESMPYIFEAGAKLIIQAHDEVVTECPRGTSEWLADKLTQTFTRSDLLPGLPLVGEAHIGDSWGDSK